MTQNIDLAKKHIERVRAMIALAQVAAMSIELDALGDKDEKMVAEGLGALFDLINAELCDVIDNDLQTAAPTIVAA